MMQNKPKIFNRYVLFLLCLPCCLLTYRLDNDFWFLSTAGRYVFAHGIPHMEPFSFHENLTFIMQQWLSASVFHLLYSRIGALGIYILMCICFFLTFLTLYRLCMYVSHHNTWVSACATFLAEIYAIQLYSTRPMIFTALILATLLWALEHFYRENKLYYLVLIPLLSLLQINVHSAMWLMLFLYAGTYAADIFIQILFFHKKEHKKLIALCAALAVAFLFGFINPYGWGGMTYVFRSYGISEINTYIKEMKSISLNTVLGFNFFFLLIVPALVVFFYKKGTLPFRALFLLAGTLYLAISSYRSFILFVLVFPLGMTLYMQDFKVTRKIKMSKFENTVVLTSVFLLIVILSVLLPIRAKETKLPDSYAALSYLKDSLSVEELSHVRLYISYNEGGMAEYLGIPAFMDPRAEVYIKSNNRQKDILTDYFSATHGKITYQELCEQYRFTHLYFLKSESLYPYCLKDTNYRTIYQDEHGRLFERKDFSEKKVAK